MGSQFKFLVGSSLKIKTIMKASREIMKQNFLLFFFPERTEKLFVGNRQFYHRYYFKLVNDFFSQIMEPIWNYYFVEPLVDER